MRHHGVCDQPTQAILKGVTTIKDNKQNTAYSKVASNYTNEGGSSLVQSSLVILIVFATIRCVPFHMLIIGVFEAAQDIQRSLNEQSISILLIQQIDGSTSSKFTAVCSLCQKNFVWLKLLTDFFQLLCYHRQNNTLNMKVVGNSTLYCPVANYIFLVVSEVLLFFFRCKYQGF